MSTSTLPIEIEATDEELAARGALADLYRRYARRVLGLLASLNVPAADREDLLQETWLRVHGKLREWSTPAPGGDTPGSRPEHFRGFLFTVARNLSTDWHRRRRPVPLDEKSDRADPQARTPAERLEESELRERFRRCLDRLSQIESDLVRGRIAGDDYEGLAKRLSLPLKQAYRIFFESKARLQRCVDRGIHEPGHP